MGKRLRYVLLAVPAAMLAMAFAGPAAAQGGPGTYTAQDPQTANVPYLAWAGNQVKLTKCFTAREAGGSISQIPLPTTYGKFVVEDWSGVELTGPSAGFASKEPQFLNDADGDVVGQIPTSGPHAGSLCYAVHISSLKPGLAVVKLAVRDDLLRQLPGLDVLQKHQFLVIWMRSNAPTIREVANADFPSVSVGDPTGDGIFNLGTATGRLNGLIEIDVTGTVPMGNNFSGIFPGDSITLPGAWRSLADRFSFDSNAADGGVPGSAVDRWDIHDDQTPYSDHAGANSCTPRAGVIDAVDNCLGGSQIGPFSHFYGYSQLSTDPLFDPHWTLGPFDPLRPRQSLLPDNKTDAGDAPGPPLRIDVRIAAGGAGGLLKADKDDIYVRNRALPDSDPHNLYAPFYQALIPAALPGETGHTSGVAGSFTNNFPGFLTDYYDYWDLLINRRTDPLRGRDVCRDELGAIRTSPLGDDHVAVYTDEHFEAFVAYNPNTGFNFAVDNQGACDLDLPANRSFLSNITASAVYPDQPVIWDQANKTSNTLVKRTNIAASKVLTCVPKRQFEMFCMETIRDILGNPVVGAQVQFTRSPEGLIEFDAPLGNLGGFCSTASPQQQLHASSTENRVVVVTNSCGQAGVVITETRNICVDVLAHNLGTRAPRGNSFNPGVRRQIYINPFAGTVVATCGDASGTGTQTQPATPVVTPSAPLPQNTPAVTISAAAPAAAAAIVSLGGNPTPVAAAPEKAAPKAAAARASLETAQLLTLKGNRYLVLKLKSKLNSAKVRITLIGKNGKAQRVVIRTVATNRTVIVPNLKLGKATKSVKVSVV
jgi:hypothetical protein